MLFIGKIEAVSSLKVVENQFGRTAFCSVIMSKDSLPDGSLPTAIQASCKGTLAESVAKLFTESNGNIPGYFELQFNTVKRTINLSDGSKKDIVENCAITISKIS